MMYMIVRITMSMKGESPSVPMNFVRFAGRPRYPTVTDRKEAPLTMSMIMQLVFTDPMIESTNTFRSILRERKAKKTEPTTPTAAASVGVAQPR